MFFACLILSVVLNQAPRKAINIVEEKYHPKTLRAEPMAEPKLITLPYRETKEMDLDGPGHITADLLIDALGNIRIHMTYKSKDSQVPAWLRVTIFDSKNFTPFDIVRKYYAFGNGASDDPGGWIDPKGQYKLDFRLGKMSVEIAQIGEAPPIPDTTKAGQVILLPGILGTDGNVENIRRWIEDDESGGGRSAVIYDWPKLHDFYLTLQDMIELNVANEEIARRFAIRLKEWQQRNPKAKVYLVGMSGGAMIATAACEQQDFAEGYYIRNKSIEKIVFLSGCLSIRHSLQDVNRCAVGTYNYCSLGDSILSAHLPTIFIFGIPIKLNVTVQFPPVGLYGIHPTEQNYPLVTSQLFWLNPDDNNPTYRGKRTGNNGDHLMPGCLSEDYFKEFILPLFRDNEQGLPKATAPKYEGWRHEFHPRYEQEQREFKP